MSKKKEKKKYVNQSQLLKSGFTKTMIDTLLPKPQLIPNPHYKGAAPMKLWSRKAVAKVKKTDAYKIAYQKSLKRRVGAAKAVETKKEKLEIEVHKMSQCITVQKISDKALVRDTLDRMNFWRQEHNDCALVTRNDVSTKTLNRWIVNYIRHNLVSYDSELLGIKGRVGINEAYPRYKEAVLNEIAVVYPKYAEECKRQVYQLHKAVELKEVIRDEK